MVQPINNITHRNMNKNYSRQFGGELIDGSIAKVRVNFNKSGNPISMECYTFDKMGNNIGGKAIGRHPKLKLTEIFDFLKDLASKNKNWDAIREFSSILHR